MMKLSIRRGVPLFTSRREGVFSETGLPNSSILGNSDAKVALDSARWHHSAGLSTGRGEMLFMCGMQQRRLMLLVVTALAALLVSGCGGDGASQEDSAEDTTTTEES